MVDKFNQSGFWVTLNEMDHNGNGVRNYVASSFGYLCLWKDVVGK